MLAVRRSLDGGVQTLSTPQGVTNSEALAISVDGSVIAGWFLRTGQDWRAARWIGSEDFLELLMPSAPGFSQSQANSISADGSVIVGYAGGSVPSVGMRWLNDGSINATIQNFIPSGVNHDGSLMVGRSYIGGQHMAARWTSESGPVNLLSYLRSRGEPAYGWSALWSATAVSQDGKVIVGIGAYNGNPTVGFVAFAPLECPGDLFVDGRVNGADLGVLLSQWGTASNSEVGDIDANGVVDADDLGVLLAKWGTCP
jgi:uncharacterized membrane protein